MIRAQGALSDKGVVGGVIFLRQNFFIIPSVVFLYTGLKDIEFAF